MSKGAPGGTATYDVYVTNIPPDANERAVREPFMQFGGVQSLNVFDARNGSGRVAFVRFRTEKDADEACKANLEMAGNKLAVRRARRPPAQGAVGGGKKPFGNRSPREAVAGPDIVPVSDVSDRRSQSSESEISNFGEVTKEEKVVVTHVENAICLWVQTITETNAEGLASLTTKLQQTCPAGSTIKGTPVNGKHYGTMFSQDDQWYRCLIRQFNSAKGKAKVLYVDFGNVEEKDVTELVEIPQSIANIQPFAQKIVLHGLFMKTDCDSEPVSYESYISGVQFLRELTEGQILSAHLTIPLRDNMGYYGDVLVNNNSISEMVIQQGFATRRPLLPNKRTFRGQSSPAGGSSPQRPNTGATADRSKPDRSDMSDLKIKLEKERAEKDMLTLELASLKGKLKNIQAEHTALARKASEDYTGRQIQEIVSLAEKVRSLRSQFPSDSSSSDCLSESLLMASAEDRVSLDSITSLRRVNAALDAYTGVQNAIRACQTTAELEGLEDQRDECRAELHTSLRLFLDEAEGMPLDQRMEKVQAVLANLALSYNGFLHFIVNKQPGLENAKSMYDEWKQKVLSGFEEVRCQSNLLQDSITSNLGELQKLMVLDGQVTVTTSAFDIDGLFKKYISALQREVDVTDVQHSNEACFMASIISEVKRVFEEELKIIQSVRCLSVEFAKQKTSIEEWLHQKPDLQDIRNVRKTLRGLKSKLRHLLADKEDIDENEDGSEDERARITIELSDLRREIQETVLSEEGLQMKYSVLQEEHFPELRLTHADLNLDAYQTYKGLLKTSREIDHYDPTHCPVLAGCHQVTFVDTPAIIKEYVIDDQIHASKEEFLKRALAYNQVISPSLVPIQAAFLAKGQKQVYVQTPASGVSLSQFVRGEDTKPWVIQKILRSVTEAVIALHKAGIAHGDISPQSVIVTETKTAQLTLPDFSRPVVDPSRTWFISPSGLEFRAPEEDMTQAPTVEADLFCLGLLYIWIHLPNSSIERNVNGVPVLENLSINETVRYAAHALLCSQPSSRVAASEILQTGYFQDILPDLLHVDTVVDLPEPEQQAVETVDDETVNRIKRSDSLLDSPTDDLPQAVLCPQSLLGTQAVDSATDETLINEAVSNEAVCEDEPVDTGEEYAAVEPTSGADVLVNGEPDNPVSDLTDPVESTNVTSMLPLPSDESQEEDMYGNDGEAPDTDGDDPTTQTATETVETDADSELLVNKHTVDSLVSLSAGLPPTDGSGDSVSVVPQMDNAALIENLLSFTSQHTNNMGF